MGIGISGAPENRRPCPARRPRRGGGGDGEETTGATTTEENIDAPIATNENIVAVAQGTPDLSTMVEAVSAAGLVETLEEPGPHTVFAPTNEAFEALGGTLETLLEPKNQAELAEVLTYHVGRAS